MKNQRDGFTLIELLVSISILSIMMIFLYKSYASLNISNKFYKQKISEIEDEQLKKRVMFLDFSLLLDNNNSTVIIFNQNKKEDAVFFQSSHSIHKRYNPYIAYIVNNSKLYRLESLKAFKVFPITQESEFSVDYLGEVNSFRVYYHQKKTQELTSELFLIHVDFKTKNDILLKVKALNESID